MKMYAVKNDNGEFYDFDSNGDFWKEALCRKLYTISENEAQDVAHDYGGHVVPLIEKPAPVEVSEDEAEMLKLAKDRGWRVAGAIHRYMSSVTRVSEPFDIGSKLEDRLMRAYVNGWTVEKPKRYVLPMPYGADDDDPDDTPYAAVNREYHAGPAWYQGPCVSFKKAQEQYSVTQADIDAAPDWVKAIKPVEVQDE